MNVKDIIKRNKILLENFSYLSILQIFSLVFPLITYPYLLRLFGLDLYGVIVFAQAIVMNISILINYGFNLSGTQLIATKREETETINEAVSTIYIIKGIIWLGCFLIYSIVVYSFNYFAQYRLLYITTYFLTINEVLLPIWYFQGIEKMKYITFINLGVRSIFVILIFVFVHNASQYFYVPLLNSIGAVAGGISALFIVFKVHKVSFKFPSRKLINLYFHNSTPFFISSLSVNIYAYLGKLVVGSFLGMKEIAIYDMAEKATSLLKIPASLSTQATFPRICRMKSIRFVNRLMFITVSFVAICYIVLFIFTGKVVEFLSGENIPVAVTTIRILTFTAICACINGFFGSNRLVVWGYKTVYMKVAVSGCFIYLLTLAGFYITNHISIYSIASIPLLTESTIVLAYIWLAKRFNILA